MPSCETGQDRVCEMYLSLNVVLQLTTVPRVPRSYSFSFVLGCHQLVHYRVEPLCLACGSLKHHICLSLPWGKRKPTKRPRCCLLQPSSGWLRPRSQVGLVLQWVQGRELPLTDCQDKDGKDTNHLPEAQPPDHHRLRSDRVRLLFGGFCGGLGKRGEKREKWLKVGKGKDATNRSW